ncbi:MAG: RdgB/HAM1 family non-canonical purine NTP pyrophosphatase [Arcobacter sp.]|nr:RdgB/HAM1 family non-canonical purine NTP pyrophosphatase [Arcobacter sp.]
MTIVLASTNKGKIKELKTLLPEFEVITMKDILGDIEVVEDGKTFQENAIKKAKTIFEMIEDKKLLDEYLVISDDSGLSVPLLDNEPNIYSARYAGVGATDEQNIDKLTKNLQAKNLKITPAFYTTCIAIAYKNKLYTAHGWFYGNVVDEVRGDSGFGYDPIFIPSGYDKTLGELPDELKKQISHRTKALSLAMKIIRTLFQN